MISIYKGVVSKAIILCALGSLWQLNVLFISQNPSFTTKARSPKGLQRSIETAPFNDYLPKV